MCSSSSPSSSSLITWEIYTDLDVPEADAMRTLIARLLPLVKDKP